MDQDEQQRFQHKDAYSMSGAFGSWDPDMHFPINQQWPEPSGHFDSYYSYGPMCWPPVLPLDPCLNPWRDLDSMVNRAVERAILQIIEQLEETGYRRDNSGGDNGKQVSNSTTATQTDVSPTSGSRQQRYPPRPSDSAATNNSTQGTCTHTLSMQYIGGAGPCGISIGPLNVLNCQGNTAAHEGELLHPTDSTQSKFVKYLPKNIC